jgi:hypothetical protein
MEVMFKHVPDHPLAGIGGDDPHSMGDALDVILSLS